MTKAEMMRSRGLDFYREREQECRDAIERGSLRDAHDLYEQAAGMIEMLTRLTLISLDEASRMNSELVDNCFVSYAEISYGARIGHSERKES